MPYKSENKEHGFDFNFGGLVMTNERLNTLLYNAIICLEEYGCDGKQLELDIGITEEEYEKIMQE